MVKNLLMDLIKIPSPSGEEKQIGEFIINRLKKNFKVKKQIIGNRFNILAYRGKPEIILSTHLDTVPGNLKIKEDKDFIYGGGACDAKASIASMIIAAEKLVEQGIKNVGLLFDVSEENDFAGIKKAVNLVDPKFVIVGEPTDLKVVIGQKGLLGIKVKCYGKSAPGSTPEKGVSAINKLLIQLIRLGRLNSNNTTVNIGKIKGGSAANMVPDYAEAIIEFRTSCSNYKILKFLKKFKINFDVLYSYNPAIIKDNLIADLDLDKIIVPYFTEMHFWNKKTNCIVFGPGEYRFAHSDEEKIRKKDLEEAVEQYINIITYLNNQTLSKTDKERLK